MSGMRLSLGPIAYYWPREAVFRFYDEAARAPIDIVHLGEVVCGKRHELRTSDWIAIGRALRDAGKEVVLSTFALPESETDLRVTRAQVANGEFAIEANDMGAVRLAAEANVPFVVGPHVNAYHPATLACLAGLGAIRWVAPIELARDAIADVVRVLPPPMQGEVFGYGRLPLAMSARCFTARNRGTSKDDCGFRCIDDPDGFAVTTIDAAPAFVLNGTQTQSALPYSLVREVSELAASGIAVFRIAPQSRHTFDIVRFVRAVLDGGADPGEAADAIDALTGAPATGGYWQGRPGCEVMHA